MPKEYPVLDNSPINKWKVTKLREELKKRNLPVKGLKEALVNRLDEAIQKDMEAQEMKGEDSESESKPMSSDCVQIVDDAQRHITSDFCEAEDTVAKDETKQKHITGESCEADDTVAKDETSDCPKETDSAKCMDDSPTGGSVHFAMDGERKDTDAPLEIIPSVDANDGMSNSDRFASTERAPNDTVGEDEVVKSQHDVEIKTISAKETSEFNVLENCNVVPDTSREITLVYKSDTEEGFKKLTKMDAEPSVSDPSTTQVHEVIPSLGSEVKSDSIHTDTLPICVTNQPNDDLNPDNVKLEQEIVRSEMVLPSSSKDLPGVGVDHPLDDKMPSKSDGLVGGADDNKSSNVNYSMTNENADQSLVVDVPNIEHNDSSKSNELLEGLPKDGNLNGADFSCKEKESPEEKNDVGVSAKETDVKEHNMDLKDPNSNELLEGLPKDGNLNKDTFSYNEKDLSGEGNFDAGAYANEAKSQDVSTLERNIDHNTSNSTERLGVLSKDPNSNEDKFPCKEKESLEEETNIDSSTKEASFHDVSMIEHTTDDMGINSTEHMGGVQKDENVFVDKVPCEENDLSAKEKTDIDSSNRDTNFEGKEKESSEDEKIDVDVSAQEANFQAEGESTDSGFGKATDVAGESLEKINLDQSSADDSMDEDIADSKNIDSEHISFEVLGKNIEEPLTKEPSVEMEGGSNAIESSDIHSAAREVSLEDGGKNLNLPDKRKFQDAVAPENKEPAKRQRKWNYGSLNTSESKTSSVLLLTPKQISVPNFTSSDSMIDADAPKERIVPDSSRTPTDSLRIDNFVRPFTLKAVQELLGKTGKVCSFWMDHIKTHCYVTFSSVEEAIETRKAVYNLQWPANGGRCLLADFVTPQDVKSKMEAGPSKPAPPPATGASLGPTPTPPVVSTPSQPPLGQQKGVAPWEQLERPHPLSRQPPAYDLRPATVKEQAPVVADNAEPPLPTLDDLFRKTKATPWIYYLPLTDEQVSAKLNKQLKK